MGDLCVTAYPCTAADTIHLPGQRPRAQGQGASLAQRQLRRRPAVARIILGAVRQLPADANAPQRITIAHQRAAAEAAHRAGRGGLGKFNRRAAVAASRAVGARRAGGAGGGGHSGHSGHSGSDGQGIQNLQGREAAEVTVGRPEFAHAMLQAQSSDSRIVNPRTRDVTRLQQLAQQRPVPRRLLQKRHAGRRHPGLHLLQRVLARRRVLEKAQVGHNADEFVNTGPRQAPGCPTLRQLCEGALGASVLWHFGAVRIDQHTGVDGDHRFGSASVS